jgi:hypothetical protein
MQVGRRDDHRVVAIDPTSRGFGFVVLEGPGFLVDWGTRDLARADSERALSHVAALVHHYRPDAVVLEDVVAAGARRRHRVQALINAIGTLAASGGVAVEKVSRLQVHRVFARAEATTKHRIAGVIADHFPELAPRLPPPRRAWMSEDARMSIFDAAALALTHYFLSDHDTLKETYRPRA